MRRRRSRVVGPFLGGIGLLLIAEAALLVTVFVSPSSGTAVRRGATRAARAWNGTKQQPGIEGRIVNAAKGVNRSLLHPLWNSSRPARQDSPFAGCASCHRDYAAQRRYGSVFMDHPVHAQKGVTCATCHTDVSHPNPPVPEEATCARCHQEVEAKGACTLCHPPGSLPHFYVLGYPRGPVECSTCHPNYRFPTGAGRRLATARQMNGTDRAVCMSCHQPAKCASCHGQKHPQNWGRIHGPTVVDGDNSCYRCHAFDWCTEACHDKPLHPLVPRPLPTLIGP